MCESLFTTITMMNTKIIMLMSSKTISEKIEHFFSFKHRIYNEHFLHVKIKSSQTSFFTINFIGRLTKDILLEAKVYI